MAEAAGGHLLLYAHGGLNSVKSCAARTKAFQPVMNANGIQQVHFIWETGLFAELRDIIFGKQTQIEERAGGFSDHWDSMIEKLTAPWAMPCGRKCATMPDWPSRSTAPATRPWPC